MQEYRGLQYKPSGISPQGRPRVYFCCHEDDFERLFEPISKEILDIVPNASIWYYDPKEGIPDDEAYYRDLGEMQLFVVPVTWKFIYQDCHARNAEFAYAIEHHIPILPLMQETGLENDFNKVCGDLQMLDKEALRKDPTAIPYEEKLKTFLNSFLISDETAKKIREAFDAYIFLSYRKKDRVYAQSIMRLIHENDFCRDVAIWYDEFLTPGENFNEAIKKALEKSVLFTLVVTPSLLEKPNYIEEYEYPEAMKSGKPMLPIEAVETDNNSLSKMYPDISIHKPGEVEMSLRELFINVALQERKDDLAHNFLIGLAYLSGIDVEVNHERAVELITSAAEADLPEACEKLVSMYNNGEGVERDYHTAIKWQERYVKCLRKIVDKEPNKDNFQDLFNGIWAVGDAQIALGDIIKAKESYNLMLKTAETMVKKGFEPGLRNLSVSYNKLGNIHKEEGQYDQSKEWYQKGLMIAESIYQETKTLESGMDLTVSYNNLGDIHKAEGKLEEAEKWYQKSLEIDECIFNEGGTIELLRNLALDYERLGTISTDQREFDKAREWYMKLCEISEYIYSQIRSLPSCRDLSISYNRLGDISFRQEYFEEAKGWYGKSLIIDEAFYEETETLESKNDLANIYGKFGNVCYEQNSFKEAGEWYLKSLALFESINKETNTFQSFWNIGVIYERLGNVSLEQGDFKLAKEWYQKSLEVRESICQKTNAVESWFNLYAIYYKLGDLSRDEGQYTEAQQWYQKSLDQAQYIYQTTQTLQSMIELSLIYDRLGDLNRLVGQFDFAERWYKQGLKICGSIYDGTKYDDFYRNMTVFYIKLGYTGRDRGNMEEAKIWFRKCLNIFESAYQETGTLQSISDLLFIQEKLAEISELENNLEKAGQWYLSSLNVLESMNQEWIQILLQYLESVYDGLYRINRKKGNLEKADYWYQKRLEVRKSIHDCQGTSQS